MKVIEFTVHTTTEGSELVADILWNYTVAGVSILDANDLAELRKQKDSLYWDYVDEDAMADMGEEARVRCFLEPSAAPSAISAIERELSEMIARSEGFIPFGSMETTKREVEGDEWIETWKKYFRPIHLGKIVVVPEWIEYTPQPDEKIILLDSNMAFGTGEHETTSLCVELMQDYLAPDSVCIDVGCGSGILGISAIKLGARKAYLTDIDMVAVRSATHNSKLNGTDAQTVVAHSNLLENADVVADVMFANITGEILCMLAPSIPKNLKEEGVLILSGIIESRLEMVKEAYRAVGMRVIRQERKGEWFALVLKRGE